VPSQHFPLANSTSDIETYIQQLAVLIIPAITHITTTIILKRTDQSDAVTKTLQDHFA